MAGTAGELENAIVEAYRAGRKVEAIEREFDVHRSTIYEILKRKGVRMRTNRPAGDAEMAAIYKLVEHQGRRISELENEVAEKDKEIARLAKALAKATPNNDGKAHKPRPPRQRAM
jgi:predicted RNase H-like nuclease (RuvC/YqgF family)